MLELQGNPANSLLRWLLEAWRKQWQTLIDAEMTKLPCQTLKERIKRLNVMSMLGWINCEARRPDKRLCSMGGYRRHITSPRAIGILKQVKKLHMPLKNSSWYVSSTLIEMK